MPLDPDKLVVAIHFENAGSGKVTKAEISFVDNPAMSAIYDNPNRTFVVNLNIEKQSSKEHIFPFLVSYSSPLLRILSFVHFMSFFS